MTIFVKDGVRARDIAVPTFSVADGGTDATDAATARSNLGATEGLQGQANGGALTTALSKINFKNGSGSSVVVAENVDTIDVTVSAAGFSGKLIKRAYVTFTAATGIANVGVSQPPLMTEATLIGQLVFTPLAASSTIVAIGMVTGSQNGLVGGNWWGWIGRSGAATTFQTGNYGGGFPNSATILRCQYVPGSTAAQTWQLRSVVNGAFAGAIVNAQPVAFSSLEILEFAA